LCQRSSGTFASGCLPQKFKSTFRAMTRIRQDIMFPKREQARLALESF
jgi:hypothetical protein